MEQHTPTTNDLALLLFLGERKSEASLEGLHNAIDLQITVQRTFGKLGQHLSQRLGSGGYAALLGRAIKIAEADFPWLAAVHVTENGDLAGFGSPSETRTASETAEGVVAVLARLIGLLDTFIGRKLCLHVLHTAWPDTIGIDTVQIDTHGSQGDSNG